MSVNTIIRTPITKEIASSLKSGDYVWARNPETGEQALKRVVQTFENETTELITITVASENIVCTKEHPFYSPEKGWVAACQLRVGDILVTVNGEFVVVEKVEHEILENPVKVYNFEVEDFHTYFVGIENVLVHNVCTAAKNAKLPTEGKIRYIPPKGVNNNLPRTSYGGYIDRFNNIWTKGPSRTIGEAFEWDVQLSNTGKKMLGWLSRDGSHINVSLKGVITHR